MKKKIKIVLGLFAILITSFLAVDYLSQPILKLNIAVSSDLDTFDPAQAFNDDSLKVLSQIYEPLYQYHYLKRPYEVEPLIADGLPTISSDGLVYTIKIKKNIRYHAHPVFEGARFVEAQDFINQIKRLAFIPLKSNGKWIFADRVEGFEVFSQTVGENYENLFKVGLSGVEAIDKHTLQIRLRKPDARMIYFLAMNFVVPVPIEIIKYYNNDLSSIMIGTGPYFLSSWSVNDSLNLKKFTNYRDDLYPSSGDRYANTNDLLLDRQKKIPFYDEIHIKILKDLDMQWDYFFDGKLDIIDVPKHKLSEALSNSINYEKKSIGLKHFPSLSSRWLSFNFKNKKFSKKVRQAIAYAVNHEKYLSELFNNTNLKANSIYAPGIIGYEPTHNLNYFFDLNKSKKLLLEAGYNEKNQLKVTYSTRSATQASLNEAELVKKMLESVGIRVKIKVLEFKEFLSKGRAGELEFFTDQWIYDYPDAENLVQLLISKNHPGINKSGYSNQRVDELYQEILSVTDEALKLEYLRQIEEIIGEDLPWVMLSYESSYVLHQKHVHNLRYSSVARNMFKYINYK